MSDNLYDQDLDNYNWLADQVDFWETDQAMALGRMMIDKFSPKSVIDMGCSSGIYLVPFIEANIDVLGVDGASGVGKWIPGSFRVFDLRKPYVPDRKYDLCYCIEVLEHIRPEYSDIVVESLSRCSDTIFVSAARPGQNGDGHVNEATKEFWLSIFSKFGFGMHPRNDEVMSVINSDPVYEVERTRWLRANGMLLGKIS